MKWLIYHLDDLLSWDHIKEIMGASLEDIKEIMRLKAIRYLRPLGILKANPISLLFQLTRSDCLYLPCMGMESKRLL